MILTKNRLKKIRKRIDDDDDMLYYLKYSHLEPIRENDILGIDKATQFPDIMNNFAQTDTKDMADKETDTYDELNTIDPPYYLTLASNNFKSKEPSSRAEKMAQVWATTVEKKTPPTSNSEDDDDGFMSRNVDRGLRMAQLTGSAMLQAFNIADTVGSAVLSPVIDSAIDYLLSNPSNEYEEEEEVEVPTSSVDAPQHLARDRSRSRSDDEDNSMGHRLLRRGASRGRSISPASSGKASSAKTTPKKND